MSREDLERDLHRLLFASDEEMNGSEPDPDDSHMNNLDDPATNDGKSLTPFSTDHIPFCLKSAFLSPGWQTLSHSQSQLSSP